MHKRAQQTFYEYVKQQNTFIIFEMFSRSCAITYNYVIINIAGRSMLFHHYNFKKFTHSCAIIYKHDVVSMTIKEYVISSLHNQWM